MLELSEVWLCMLAPRSAHRPSGCPNLVCRAPLQHRYCNVRLLDYIISPQNRWRQYKTGNLVVVLLNRGRPQLRQLCIDTIAFAGEEQQQNIHVHILLSFLECRSFLEIGRDVPLICTSVFWTTAKEEPGAKMLSRNVESYLM